MRKYLLWVALVACAGAFGPGSAAGLLARSGIAGRVVAGPTCPVERVPPDPQCAPRPLAARLRVRPEGRPGRGRVVQSGPDGRFRLRLVPGRYILTPLPHQGSPFPRPGPARRVTVRAFHFTRVTITYDTGIR